MPVFNITPIITFVGERWERGGGGGDFIKLKL